jgi:vacuolar-type H+-ATPase subunit I/STV1
MAFLQYSNYKKMDLTRDVLRSNLEQKLEQFKSALEKTNETEKNIQQFFSQNPSPEKERTEEKKFNELDDLEDEQLDRLVEEADEEMEPDEVLINHSQGMSAFEKVTPASNIETVTPLKRRQGATTIYQSLKTDEKTPGQDLQTSEKKQESGNKKNKYRGRKSFSKKVVIDHTNLSEPSY